MVYKQIIQRWKSLSKYILLKKAFAMWFKHVRLKQKGPAQRPQSDIL